MNNEVIPGYLKSMLSLLGFGHVWHQHSVGNKVMFLSEHKQRLIDTAAQNMHSDVITNHKLKVYIVYKSTLEIETYLKLIISNVWWIFPILTEIVWRLE